MEEDELEASDAAMSELEAELLSEALDEAEHALASATPSALDEETDAQLSLLDDIEPCACGVS